MKKTLVFWLAVEKYGAKLAATPKTPCLFIEGLTPQTKICMSMTSPVSFERLFLSLDLGFTACRHLHSNWSQKCQIWGKKGGALVDR